MKIQKHTLIESEIEIDGITLLSIEEYEACRQYIPQLHQCWWLRSPGYSSEDAAYVYDDGIAYGFGIRVDDFNVVVRPALKISNPEASNLQIGDKFRLFDYDWTVISNRYALCDSSIGSCCFREDIAAEDANDYESSDVKEFVEGFIGIFGWVFGNSV